MKIIALEKEYPDAKSDQYKQLGEAEARKAWELQQAGFIREIYFREDETSAVLILEATTTEEAKHKLEELPFVKNKLIYFELIPLKAYPGYERLFKDH